MSPIGLPTGPPAIGLFNTWRAGLHAEVARRRRCAGAAARLGALLRAVFLAGNTLILRDYFLRTRRGGRRELKNPDT